MNAAFGLEVLDRALDGGLKRPSSLLLYSEVLAEKCTFAELFVVAGLRGGETCLYMDLYRSPRLARREFAKFGEIPQERLVVTGVPASSDGRSGGTFGVEGVPEPEAILASLRDVLEEKRPHRVILDSLDLLAEQLSPSAFESFMEEFLGATTASGAVAGLLFVEWSYHNGQVPALLDQSDYRIEFRCTVQEGALLHKLRFRQGGEDPRVTRWIPFGLREGHGLVLRFPRVLVVGLPGSGKSSFVRAAAQSAEGTEPAGGGVAFDYGRADGRGVEVELLGLPGQKRFAFLLPVSARGTLGLFLVVDSTMPEELEEATELRNLVGSDIPAVVVANKRDLDDPMPVEEIQEGVSEGDHVPVVEVVASEGRGVRTALETLIDLMVWGGPRPRPSLQAEEIK
ncbi:MAG: ATPase domain-containing protein [Thermoplasmata archaeon]